MKIDRYLRSDLFATAFGVVGASIVRLVSAIVLTRLLYPEAYGIVAIVASIATVIELISDIGVLGFLIRDKNAEEPRYINTCWTLRVVRGFINFAILFLGAPLIASLYGSPILTDAIRMYSFTSILFGLESLSFAIAIRNRKAYIVSYSELFASFFSTLFVIAASYILRDYRGMIYGMLLNQAFLTLMSYRFYRHLAPRLQIDRQAAKDLFDFSKYVMPSSMLALATGQYDKIVFLRLFDLHLMGLYGVASNVAAPVNSLISNVTRRVLYARCAHGFRTAPGALRLGFYRENVRLFVMIMFLPAAIGGAADFIVHFLFDSRYAAAGPILRAFMIQAMMFSISASTEQLLVAAGHIRVILVGNLLRLGWLIPASLAGYYFWGFTGFLYGCVSSGLPVLLYNAWVQSRAKLIVPKYELLGIAFAAIVFVVSMEIGGMLTRAGWTLRAIL